LMGVLFAGAPLGTKLATVEGQLAATQVKLRQYTQECDDAAFLVTLNTCFEARRQDCGLGSSGCSREAMEQCDSIATGAHCTGRKE
jgi:hypothetical protein